MPADDAPRSSAIPVPGLPASDTPASDVSPPGAPPSAGLTTVQVRRNPGPADYPRALNLQLNPAGTEDEIRAMVHAFYARVRADAELGPIFAAHVQDWDTHLVRLTDFWSSLLRGTTRFSGSPMQKHAALPALTAALFQRWLGLFHETCETLPNRAMAERAQKMAGRIARSLWLGYQLQQAPEAAPTELRQP